MSLMGLLIFSLIPQEALRTTYLETAVKRVELDLKYAQELARTTNANHGVNFVANGSYTVYRNTIATPATDPLTRQPLIKNFTTEEVQILNNVQFEFDPLGRPVLGSGGFVQIGDGASTVSLQVTPNTGVVVRP